jgi:3-oxoacyl-[acyl-carrier-protein] synthase III
MAFFSINNVQLKGISAAVPKNTVSNFDLKGFEAEDLKKLIATIGIENRRVAENTMCASDLCVIAAEKLITNLQWNKNDIEVLFFVSQTPDFILPGTSTHLQERLGLPKTCVTFDINQGCAGYVYGLSLITGFMAASKLKKGLLLVGDTITKLISESDKSLLPIFSDAGTASALSYDEQATPIYFNISTEGKDYDAIIVNEGGTRKPHGDDKKLVMKGLDVFNFSLKKVVPNVDELLAKANCTNANIDYFVFHQANQLILNSLASKLNISNNKVPSSLKNFGNTSCATIPLTIVNHFKQLNKTENLKLLLSGFGVGLSLASSIIDFKNVSICNLIEV